MDTIHLKSGSDYQDKQKGYESTYKFYDGNGDLYLSGDIYGECIKSPTVYTSPRREGHEFTMTAKGKFLTLLALTGNKLC